MPRFLPSSLWFSRFKRVYLAFFLSYLIMLTVPVAGILYLYHQVTVTTERNCAASAISQNQEVSADLRSRLSWMDSQASRFLLDSQLTQMMTAGPLSYGDKRVNQFTAFIAHLDDLIGAYDANDQGYRMLFQDSELVFYHGAMSHGLEFAFEHLLHYESMTYDQWYSAVFSGSAPQLLPIDNIRLKTSRVRALTYNYPILRKTTSGTKKAVLQFFIEESLLYPEAFHPLNTGYLLSSEGEILAIYGAKTPFPDALSRLTEAEGCLRMKGGLLAYAQVDNGLIVAEWIPEDVAFQDVIAMRTPMLIIILLCAVLEGFLCWGLARQNARPIEVLAADMNQMIQTPRQGNELEYLHQGIIQLQQSQEDTQRLVLQSKRAEVALLLNHLLHHHNERDDALLALGERAGISLQAKAYCAAIIALPDSASRAALSSLPECPQGTRAIISEGSQNSLNALYLTESEGTEQLHDTVMRHLRDLLAHLPAGTRMGLGRSFASLEDVPFSYDQAAYCLQANAADVIISFDLVSPGINSLFFPLEQQQRLINAVKHNNASVIDQEFDLILKENTINRHLSTLLKRTLLSSIEALLLMASEDFSPEDNFSDYLRSLQRSNDFREELDILRQEFKRIAERIGGRITQVNSQRSAMESFLEAHYGDPLLSISTAAEHFGFSESYFSVLFKDLLGEPYSAYLEKLRLNKACGLLRQTDASIEEISAQVGYNHSTTFRRAFKRVMGISPVQYRSQAHLDA